MANVKGNNVPSHSEVVLDEKG